MNQSLGDRVINRLIGLHARRVLARLRADARRAPVVQDRLLMSFVRANAASDYGRAHGFASIRGYGDFVRHVPIQGYAELSPWIERVRRGDVRAMFGARQRVRMFAMTSGTTDRPKYVPVTDRFLSDVQAGWRAFGIKALTDHANCFGRPLVQVTSPMDEARAPSGVPCGAITGLMASVQYKQVLRYYAAPLCVAYIPDGLARRYTIMRLAVPRDVGWMVTASPATVLQLVRTAESHADTIIRDVHDGTLTDDMAIPGSIRDELMPRLRADPVTARRLETIRQRAGRFRPMDYWRLGFLGNWTGGTMGLYLRQFPEYFGDVPVRDIGLLATEGRMSIPMADGTPAGMAAISHTFLEFIPVAERGSVAPTVLRVHELHEGEEYFILLTTSAGFYRYDISDCVRVTGFEGLVPLIEFLHKGDHVASVTGEKITEHQVVQAFGEAAAAVGADAVEFVLAPAWSDPPFYRLYVERGGAAETDMQRSAKLARGVDTQLARLNMEYASKRSGGRLGPIEGVAVRRGAMAGIDGVRATRFRRANEQFKHQYLYTRPGEDDELLTWVDAASRRVEEPALSGARKEA
ncbi:MAG: GH3 auxin-responsive promoter family protein [Phycisphaerales bacterium]|nr:GH3 auxin-responsive promoter family protein [Phycisphaerales bacterium]